MIEVYCTDKDGNLVERLTQWDVDQYILIGGSGLIEAPKIHFCNAVSDEALVVGSEMEGDLIKAKIPNILLQDKYLIMAYLYVYDPTVSSISAMTKATIKIPILPRQKPSNYPYVEDIDYISATSLEAKIEKEIEDLANELNENYNQTLSRIETSLETEYKSTTNAIREEYGDYFNQMKDEHNSMVSDYDGIKADYDLLSSDLKETDSQLKELSANIRSDMNDLEESYSETTTNLENRYSETIDDLVSKFSDGSPKGYFSNVEDLSGKVAGVYINDADGYVYYWDGETISDAITRYEYTADTDVLNNHIANKKEPHIQRICLGGTSFEDIINGTYTGLDGDDYITEGDMKRFYLTDIGWANDCVELIVSGNWIDGGCIQVINVYRAYNVTCKQYYRIKSGMSWTEWKLAEDFDEELNATSTNAVQNKVVATEINDVETALERIKYYGSADIVPSDESYFTVNETGETITGLTDTGKTQTELVIPYEINGKKITTLCSGSDGISRPPVSILDGNSTITKVVIPKSVTTLGGAAFANCKLASIDIPNSVTSIEGYAFWSCSSLTSIYIPDSVTSIGNFAFWSCSSLTSIYIPDSVTSIGNFAFMSCTSLTSIDIPNSVTGIAPETFKGCTSLTSINIPNSVTSIEDEAFEGCTNLTIYCEQGSYAETYAKNNNIPVVYTAVNDIGSGVEIVDNLTTSDSTKALSANQGKVLNDSKAPNSHASTSTTYGVGTTSNYGHVKVVNNLTTSTYNGVALSANQGRILKNKIDALPIEAMNGTFEVKPDGTTETALGVRIGDRRNRKWINGFDYTEGNVATGEYSVAMGRGNTVTGVGALSIGTSNFCNGGNSFVWGFSNNANGANSFVGGGFNTAKNNQLKIGWCAKDGNGNNGGGTGGDAFIIGNGNYSIVQEDGTSDYANPTLTQSNAFRVAYNGSVYGGAAYNSSGADIAELYEWQDGNPEGEDRRGLFVTLDGTKIRLANEDDTYIKGAISARPCLVGDSASEDWHGKYMTDVFGALLTQTVHHDAIYKGVEKIDPETGEKKVEKELVSEEYDSVEFILNPEYNDEEEYIPREKRPEYDYVSSWGKIVLVDDGSCEVNGFAKPGKAGKATKSEEQTIYRVMKRIDENHIFVAVG